jgi:hypothetical protein
VVAIVVGGRGTKEAKGGTAAEINGYDY